MRVSTPLVLPIGALLFCSATACKSSNPEVPRLAHSEASQASLETAEEPLPTADELASSVPPAEPVAVEPVVARVGEDEVRVSELLSAWMLADSVGLRDMLENLVTTRLVAGEAERLGITISDELLAGEFTRALTELENGLQRQQPGMRLDEWIAGSLGLDPARYRAGIQEDVRRRLLAERVVRRFVLAQDWADVRVLVAETLEEAETAKERIAAGEPFARVAGELSIDPSGKNGGRIPPVVRNQSALSRLAYSTEVGQVGGPVEEAERWMLLEPLQFHAPLEGDWSAQQAAVEASLEERPVAEPEYWLWKIEMGERHPADFEPFFELIDGAARP